MKLHPLLLAAVMLLAMAGSVQEVFAQMGGMGGGGGLGGGRSGRGGAGRDSSSPGSGSQRPVVPDPASYEQIEYRLSLLQDELNLSPGQTAVWQSFADNTLAYVRDQARERSREAEAYSVTATQSGGLRSIEQALDAARNRLTALEEVESSARALYQALNPDQKIKADLRIPAIVMPKKAELSTNGGNYGLPDLGSSVR